MPRASSGQLVFAVNISSFTRDGFAALTSYKGRTVEIIFDDLDEGVFLTPAMAARIGARKGSKVSIGVEDGEPLFAQALFAGAAKVPRVSSSKVYYALGKEGGAVVRITKS